MVQLELKETLVLQNEPLNSKFNLLPLFVRPSKVQRDFALLLQEPVVQYGHRPFHADDLEEEHAHRLCLSEVQEDRPSVHRLQLLA